MDRKWTESEIREWYNELPWPRGSNFLPSDSVNRLDMWQPDGHMERLKVADRELGLCEEIGFNTVRLWINFDVYYMEPDFFMYILEEYIKLADRHRQSVMLVLAHEEDLPFGEKFVPKELGKQKIYYNHFNRDYEQYNKHLKNREFKHYLECEETRDTFLQMIKKVVSKYREDKRVIAWNIVNEPGFALGERAVPILEELFACVRSLDPIQPLSADIWRGINCDGSFNSKEEQVAFELSDFISFHTVIYLFRNLSSSYFY